MTKNKKITCTETHLQCINCGCDELERKYITWSTNGTTVQKIKCQKCGEVMWRTNLPKGTYSVSKEEIAEALKLKDEPLEKCGQLEFDF